MSHGRRQRRSPLPPPPQTHPDSHSFRRGATEAPVTPGGLCHFLRDAVQEDGQVQPQEECASDRAERNRPRDPPPGRGPGPGQVLEEVGPLSVRAAVGDGAGGLLPGWVLLGLLLPRPRPLPRLQVGGGRTDGDLRQTVPPLLLSGPLEREGPDPEGAAVRPDRAPGEPRRGREGVLLLPGLHAHTLLHEGALQVPHGRVPVRPPGAGQQGDGAVRARG